MAKASRGSRFLLAGEAASGAFPGFCPGGRAGTGQSSGFGAEGDCTPVRAYKDKPAREQSQVQIEIECQVNARAVEAAKASLGWRVYATNASPEALSLSAAVLVYRDEYRIEHSF